MHTYSESAKVFWHMGHALIANCESVAAVVPELLLSCQPTEAPQASDSSFVCLPIKVLIPHSLLAEDSIISALC